MASAQAPDSAASQQAGNEEIRTVFMTGFPPNVHERELANLVFCLPGVLASQMNTRPATGGAPQGFVLFSTGAQAQAAIRMLHDMEFETGCHLRCELAHKNMYVKDGPAAIRRLDSGVASSGASTAGTAAGTSLVGTTHMSQANGNVALQQTMPTNRQLQQQQQQLQLQQQAYGMAAATSPGGAYAGPLLASSLAALRPTAALHAAGGAAGGTLLPAPGGAGAMAAQHAGLVTVPLVGFGPITNRHDNPPCNTLFIGNLGDGVDEKELHAIFSCQPGFKQIKLLRQARHISCFVEFMDTPSATAVHASLQGAIVPSSSRGPIRIQYSRNPYGRRSPQGTAMGMISMPVGLYAPLTVHQAAGAAGAQTVLMDAAAAAAAAGGGAAGQSMLPASMASVIMAASGGGEYAAWPHAFNMQ
ncbi:hypothetical protein GPECTOR_42g782 [Gonium pectorale]|uniref:RRM domain-containing protein n=1 Tax=Gonium pectorale TaxID=33097 RepID=A0A150G9X8_GONPE|nr:hypothetical protein GPECTOR_42g782 [Gonium pectorale]|eukprot:KXZ46573.1 hypothetical protein GPECTOR_42g782 [Gonium pectorale]